MRTMTATTRTRAREDKGDKTWTRWMMTTRIQTTRTKTTTKTRTRTSTKNTKIWTNRTKTSRPRMMTMKTFSLQTHK